MDLNDTPHSSFKVGLRATRGLRQKLVDTPPVESFDPVKMAERLDTGFSYLGVKFTGFPPTKEHAITVKVQDMPFVFPIDHVGWICLPAESYTVVLYRGGAIKASAVHLVAGDGLLLRFRFSKLGITFSRWGAAEFANAQTLSSLMVGDSRP